MAAKSRFVDQATLEALVRFQPQLDALKEAQRVAEDTAATGAAQAVAGAHGVQQAIDQARPQVAQIYGRAGLDAARTSQTLIGHDLAGLGGVADSIKGGAALEAAGMLGRLGESQAAALKDLGDRRVGAAAGATAGVNAAHDQLVKDLTKILQSKQDVAGQKGAFQAATIGQLQEAARARANSLKIAQGHDTQSNTNSVRASGIDPATGLPIPGGKLDPKAKHKNGPVVTATGARAVSSDAHLKFQNQVQEIASYVEKYKGKLPRAAIVDKLKKGRPQTSGYADPKTGMPVSKSTPGAVPYTLTKIPQYQPDLAMTAALDVALDGHLSRKTQRALQSHYVIGDLNLPTYAEWRKSGGKRVSTPGSVATIQQALAQALAPTIG